MPFEEISTRGAKTESDAGPICACGSSSTSAELVLRVRAGISIRRCKSCGLAFTDPAPYVETGECDLYATEDSSHDDPARREEFRGYARDLLARGAGTGSLRGASLLDVGCGGGELLEAAREFGAGVCGVEVNLHQRRRLERLDIPTAASVGELNDARFDWIVLSHVLEHIPKPEDFLCDLKGRLSARGRILISLPNLDSYFARKLGRFWVGLQVEQHLWHFTSESLGDLLGRARLRVLAAGASALGRGRDASGDAVYSGASFLLNGQGSTMPRLLQAALVAVDWPLRGALGAAIRRYGERRGGDNLWAVAEPAAAT